jgi:hypothetical protein
MVSSFALRTLLEHLVGKPFFEMGSSLSQKIRAVAFEVGFNSFFAKHFFSVIPEKSGINLHLVGGRIPD